MRCACAHLFLRSSPQCRVHPFASYARCWGHASGPTTIACAPIRVPQSRGDLLPPTPPRVVATLVRLIRCFQHRSFPTDSRSEEHTSELQSLMRISYAVFCLNKKTKKTRKYD